GASAFEHAAAAAASTSIETSRTFIIALSFSDGEMRDREIARDQISIVFRIEHRPLHVLSREALDRLERVPERERDDLRALALLALQDIGAAVSWRLSITNEAGRSHVFRVRR